MVFWHRMFLMKTLSEFCIEAAVELDSPLIIDVLPDNHKDIVPLEKGLGLVNILVIIGYFCRIGRNWNLLFTAPEKYE